MIDNPFPKPRAELKLSELDFLEPDSEAGEDPVGCNPITLEAATPRDSGVPRPKSSTSVLVLETDAFLLWGGVDNC